MIYKNELAHKLHSSLTNIWRMSNRSSAYREYDRALLSSRLRLSAIGWTGWCCAWRTEGTDGLFVMGVACEASSSVNEVKFMNG